jgi:HTH-type transcriptional regulator / antitoxin HigA
MIARGAPRVIHNDDELEAYTESLFKLTSLSNPTPAESEAIELLTLLVESYEKSHYSIPAADPVTLVRCLMDWQGLEERDLSPEFGSASAVSMFLSGQQELDIEQLKRVSAKFNLPADVFLAKG